MPFWSARSSGEDSAQPLRLELERLQQENMRLRLESQRPLSLGKLSAEVADLPQAISESLAPDPGDENATDSAFHVYTRAETTRRTVLNVLEELTVATGQLARQLATEAPPSEIDRRVRDRRRSDSLATDRRVTLRELDMPSTAAHDAGFFVGDDELIDHLSDYVNDGLAANEVCIVVATTAHHAQLEQRIGADLAAAEGAGRYIALDAAPTLAALQRDGAVNSEQFDTVLGQLLSLHCSLGDPVRVYGEMVGLLWADGDVAGAMTLEDLWTGLASRLGFSLLCGYLPSNEAVPGSDVAAICSRHREAIFHPQSSKRARLPNLRVVPDDASRAPIPDHPSAAVPQAHG
jgi:hypothetical protein